MSAASSRGPTLSYYQKNRDRLLTRQKKYYAENRDRLLAYANSYSANHYVRVTHVCVDCGVSFTGAKIRCEDCRGSSRRCCVDCGAPLATTKGAGRPRTRCIHCRDVHCPYLRRSYYVPVEHICVDCGVAFVGAKKRCESCRKVYKRPYPIRPIQPPLFGECGYCGALFKRGRGRGRRLYCSSVHRDRAYRIMHVERKRWIESRRDPKKLAERRRRYNMRVTASLQALRDLGIEFPKTVQGTKAAYQAMKDMISEGGFRCS